MLKCYKTSYKVTWHRKNPVSDYQVSGILPSASGFRECFQKKNLCSSLTKMITIFVFAEKTG